MTFAVDKIGLTQSSPWVRIVSNASRPKKNYILRRWRWTDSVRRPDPFSGFLQIARSSPFPATPGSLAIFGAQIPSGRSASDPHHNYSSRYRADRELTIIYGNGPCRMPFLSGAQCWMSIQPACAFLAARWKVELPVMSRTILTSAATMYAF